VSSSTKGAQTKYVSYTTDPNTILEQEQPTTGSGANNLIVLLAPEASYPVLSKLDVMGGYTLQDTLPDFKSDKKTESKGPYGTIAYNGDSLDVKGTVKITDDSDATGVVTKNTQVFGGSVSKSFETTTIDLGFTQTTTTKTTPPAPGFVAPADYFGVTQAINGGLTKTFDSFSLNVSALYTTLTPPAGYVKGEEDGSLKIMLQGTKSFEFGGQLIFSGAQRSLTAYKVQLDKVADKPGTAPTQPTPPTQPADPTQPPADQNATPATPKVAVPADGSETIGSLSFKMAPLEWIYGQATFTYTQRTFSVSDAKYQQAFEQAVGETVNELSLVLGVSKTF
jgi:hypothetical protein